MICWVKQLSTLILYSHFILDILKFSFVLLALPLGASLPRSSLISPGWMPDAGVIIIKAYRFHAIGHC